MKIRNGVQESNEAHFEGDVVGDAISIAISDQDPTGAITWLIRVYVQLPQGQFFLGGFKTNTAAIDGAVSRIVGFASCPGAIGWTVKATNAFTTSNSGFDAELWVQAGKCCGGGATPGVVVPPQPPGTGGGGGGGGFTPPQGS